MGTLREKVMVLCYWNCCIKYGSDGVYYEGSVPKKIRVMRKTALSKLLDGLCSIIGFDKQKSKFKIFGRYPVVVSPDLITYVHFPLVNDNSLETMLEVPSNHPSIDSVELYLEVKSSSDGVVGPAACSSPLKNPGSSSKRQRIQQPQEATGYVGTNVTHPSVKLERDNGLEFQGLDDNNGWVEDEADAGFIHGDGDREMTDKNSGSDGVAQGVNLTASNSNAQKDLNVPGLEASANACLNNGVDSSASKASSKTHRTEKRLSKSVQVEKPVKGKGKETDKTKVRPSDAELRNAIVDILKVVDFRTTPVTDILKRLVGKFEIDLTSRKSSIKVMIANEISKLGGGGRG